MKYLLNPKIFVIVNIIPILILSIILYNDFYIIKPLLSKDSIKLWTNFSSLLLMSFLINIFYLLDKIYSKKDVSIYCIIYNLIFNTFFIYLTTNNSQILIPRDIPNWMLSSDPIFEVYNFLLPTILLCILLFSSKTIDFNIAKNDFKFVLFTIFLPILLIISLHIYSYFFFSTFKSNIDENIAFLFLIFFLTLYGYFILNGILFLIKKKPENKIEYAVLIKLPFSFLVPLLGLFLILGFDIKFFNWLTCLIILSGIIILLPSLGNKSIRLLIFTLRALIFPISIYLFVIFLPFLPFVPILMIFFGFGFLFISPLFSFLIIMDELYSDYKYLLDNFNKYNLNLIFISAFLIIPISIHLQFKSEKDNLNQIIDYIYNPNYNEKYSFNTDKVKETIKTLKKNKIRNNQSFFSGDLPYISTYYNWLVLDNLTLSEAKINKIESIFLNKPNYYNNFDSEDNRLNSNQVKITNYNVRSSYNKDKKYWESWVDFEIKNQSNIAQSEFVSDFELPEGCYINDYYLYIGNKKEMGQLAEKKSAIWIYSNITSINQDPGLVNYSSKNKINFRVFPFGDREKRKTGIKFIHKDLINLEIDSNKIQLGNNEDNNSIIENKNYLYISADAKKKLELVERKFYFHFIIDASKFTINPNNVNKIEKLFEKYPNIKNNSKFTLVGSNLKSFNYSSQWKRNIYENDNSGGFYLERAFNYFLINNYKYNLSYYPKFIVISDNLSEAILDTDFKNIDFTFPECDYFYYINNLNEIETHSLTNKPLARNYENIDLLNNAKVIIYKTKDKQNKYISNNSQNSLLPISKDEKPNLDINTNKWEQGNLLKSNYYKLLLNPHLNDEYWTQLVKMSFKSGILSDYTSYIVLENEAQRRLLKKKQKEALNGKQALDLGEEDLNMNEPNIYLIIFILALILIFYNFKKYVLSLFSNINKL